ATTRAALAERQRLARELHDSVSQSLFAMVLTAKAAQHASGRDPIQLAATLDELHRLAQSAQVEMRALVFGLRPETLAREGLVPALQKLIAAIRVRHPVMEVRTRLDSEPDVSLEVKEVVYRVGQEALHNALKHAGPAPLELSLNGDTNEVV